MTESHYTVSEVARLAHVSVRTLHHYDDIGLLTPARRTAAGYRLYEQADLRRLHEILIFRELGMPLDAIQQIVDASPRARADALRSHRSTLEEHVRRTRAVICAVDAKLDALEKGTEMDDGKMFEGFENFDHAKYAAEAEERWGDTGAYRESARRTKQYTSSDWEAIKSEGDEIMGEWSRLHRDGLSPSAESVMAVAERHRQHITRWFYECEPAFHSGLADLFTADPRFAQTFENYGAGLAEFAAASIRANASKRIR